MADGLSREHEETTPVTSPQSAIDACMVIEQSLANLQELMDPCPTNPDVIGPSLPDPELIRPICPVPLPGFPTFPPTFPGLRIILEPFQQIVVETQSSSLQVTFDDNRSGNRWSYHDGGNSTHITELFRLPLSGDQVEILGVPPPLSPLVKWHLTVSEDNSGIPDRFPIFQPDTSAGNPPSGLHAQFTREDDGEGKVAFSFVTNVNPTTYYLVPTTGDGLQHIETFETDDSQFVFTLIQVNMPSNILNCGSSTFTGIKEEREEVELSLTL